MISENLLKTIPVKYRTAIAKADNIHIALQAQWAIESMDRAYLDDNGLMRWMSNDNIIPRGETVECWIVIGFITREQADKMAKAQKEEDSKWLSDNAEGLKEYFKMASKIAAEEGEPGFF